MNRSETQGTQLLSPGKILVAVNRHIEHELACAEAYGVGAEIQTFSLPDMLATDYADALAAMAERVKRLEGPIGLHGALIDTAHARRTRRSFAWCRSVTWRPRARPNASGPVCPFSQSVQYDAETRNVSQACIMRPAFVLARDPRAARSVVVHLHREHVRPRIPLPCDASLTLWTRRDQTCWIWLNARYTATGNRGMDRGVWETSGHVHLHDTRGTYDDHLGLGQGSLDIRSAIKTLESSGLPITYALETNTNTQTSLEFLGISKRH